MNKDEEADLNHVMDALDGKPWWMRGYNSSKIIDNVFIFNPLFSRIRNRSLEEFSGGRSIIFPIMTSSTKSS